MEVASHLSGMLYINRQYQPSSAISMQCYPPQERYISAQMWNQRYARKYS